MLELGKAARGREREGGREERWREGARNGGREREGGREGGGRNERRGERLRYPWIGIPLYRDITILG